MEIKNAVNLTPHEITIMNDEGAIVARVAPSGTLARCQETRESVEGLAWGLSHIQVSCATYGAVTGLPAPKSGIVYLVSALVLAQCAGRDDVFAPGPAVRNDAGQVVGCMGLSAAPEAPASYAAVRRRLASVLAGEIYARGGSDADAAAMAAEILAPLAGDHA